MPRVHSGGVLVANLLGSFTLGLLTMVWNAYARRDGEGGFIRSVCSLVPA